MTANEDEQFRARIGTTLRGKWHLDSLIGVGGMAVVYAATHKIGRRDAIKILLPEIAVSKELRARFEQEALAMNQLGHPATVRVFDIDTTDDGAPFMAMELLEGESLAERAQRLGDFPERELLGIVRVVLEVLEAAHERGIVHRDIKPDNLFVTTTGATKVLDFGIARMKQGSNVRTRTGAMLGTTPYMSPEQIAGREIDGRTDVFALGATMFRILSKRRVHEGKTEADLLIKMATEPAPPLRTVAPGVSAEVARITDTALAFDIGRRYQSARAMREDIDALLRGDPGAHSLAMPVASAAPAGRFDEPTGTAAPFAGRAGASIAMDPTSAAPSSGAVRHGAPSSREFGAMVQAPTMVAMQAPQAAQAPPASLSRPAVAATGHSPSQKSPSTMIVVAVAVSVLFAIGLTAAFFVLRDGDEPRTSKHQAKDDDSEKKSSRTQATASTKPASTRSEPTATLVPTDTAEPPVANDKFRLLTQQGKYLFCVDSALKHAYAATVESDGTKVCMTPDGRVPIDGLKPYNPNQPRW